MGFDADVRRQVFADCQRALPAWAGLSIDEFDFDAPKGFSTFTMGVRAKTAAADPPAVLYRRLEGKENAILDAAAEREVFLLLGAHDIAAHCYHYDPTHRIEAFFFGRTLVPADLFEAETLRAIAADLHRFHALTPTVIERGIDPRPFFARLHDKWGDQARTVLVERRAEFPPSEQRLCAELVDIYSEETRRLVERCVPAGALTFCHNDTYHGNIMKLDDGRVKLLDFEFSCMNHKAFDFANLFAETVMEHKQPDYPFFKIGAPRYGDAEIGLLIDAYLDHCSDSAVQRQAERARLIRDTRAMIPLSDYMYAMAALPLALEPVQKIRFIPYAHQRFHRFLDAVSAPV